MIRGLSPALSWRLAFLASLARLAGISIGAASLAGCAASPAVRAAEEGNLVDLRRVVSEEIRRDELTEEEARSIARAVASDEVENAKGQVGADRIRELQTCARHVSDALEERASGSDEVAAVAALVLLEEGLSNRKEMVERALTMERSDGGAAKGANAASAAWRAVRARTLTQKEDGGARRKLMLDGDQEVRIAALRAALDVSDEADMEALLEAARLDPHPVARTLAIRAIGALGGERAVLALKDMWALADEPKRQVIVVAWAMPPSLEAGGRRELTLVAEGEAGAPAIAAAIALVRAGGVGVAGANSVIARAVASGSTRDRVYAISASPLGSEEVRQAIVKAQGDSDDAVSVAALARRVEAPGEWRSKESSTERGAAIAKLLKIAREAPDSPRGRSAKGALARARVGAVLELLQRDALSKSPDVRMQAGQNLVSLRELALASALAADAEPRVRTAVSCAILRAPR
jgi:hypothetical protein